MSKQVLWIGGLAVGLALVCSVLAATAGFEAQFKIVKVENECQIMVPDGTDFVPAVEGQAYPYGSKIKTGRKSSVVISFSDGNECRVLARTELTVSEDTKDRKLKTLKLAAGKVKVSLQPDFHKSNSLNVETPTAVCGAIECVFEVEVARTLAGMVESLFTSVKGRISVTGEGFSVPVMTDGAVLQVSGNRDGSQVQVVVKSGSMQIQVLDAAGQPKTVNIPEGTKVHVSREVLAGGTSEQITVRIQVPGSRPEVITFTREITVSSTTTTTTQPPETTTTTPVTSTTTTTRKQEEPTPTNIGLP